MIPIIDGIVIPTGDAGKNIMNIDAPLSWSDLYRYVLKRVRDPAASEDITQETFARMLVYQRTQPIDNAPALGVRIALNLVNDYFRGRRSTAELDETIVCRQPKPDEVMIHRQKLQLLQKVVDRMPPLRREIFSRRKLRGETPAEISLALGLSPAAVEKHLVRGLADLQKALGKRGDWI